MRPLAKFAALATAHATPARAAVSERSHLRCPYPPRAVTDGKGRGAVASSFTGTRGVV